MFRRFSERGGYKEISKEIQYERIDHILKNEIWSIFVKQLESFYKLKDYNSIDNFFEFFWRYYLNEPLDLIPLVTEFWGSRYDHDKIFQYMREEFYEGQWFETFDIIELIVNHFPTKSRQEKLIEEINTALTFGNSAYRILDKKIVQITEENELNEIQELLDQEYNFIDSVKKHISKSIEMLSDRKTPDYRNSIKESISAVEAICQLITGEKLPLGKTLNHLEKQGTIHFSGALKSAYSSIYGFTSSEEGIRHALSEEESLDFEDAKYMLISCSAFINYLIVKANKSKIF